MIPRLLFCLRSFASIFAALLLTTIWTACGDSGHSVYIDVRTDLKPIDEFDAVRLTIDSTTERITATRSDDFRGGQRVHDGELAPGDHEVTVTLVRAGRSVVSRSALVRVDTDRGVTIVLTRSCVNVMCGSGTTCVSGSCEDPECTPETPEFCGEPECSSGTDCSAGVCGSSACVFGSCFQFDDGSCGDDAFCLPTLGCEPREPDPDAGPGADAMVDARGADASGSSDGGPPRDAGRTDTGSSDAGPTDAGSLDAGPRDAGRDVPAPHDAGPDTSGPTGDCRNPSDEGLLIGYTVQRGVNDGFACYQMHGNNAGLIQSCVQARVAVSDMCADCFVEIVQCTVDNCSAQCSNPASAQCSSCRDTFCDPAFTSCSGFNL